MVKKSFEDAEKEEEEEGEAKEPKAAEPEVQILTEKEFCNRLMKLRNKLIQN